MVDKKDTGLPENAPEKEEKKQNAANAPSESDSATFSMQGVSGKVITGKVKVKKVKKPARKPKEDQPEAEAGEVPAGQTEEASVTKTVTSPESAPKPRKIKSGKEVREAARKAEAEKKAAEKAAAEKKAKEEAQKKKQAEAEKEKEKKPAPFETAPKPRKLVSGKTLAKVHEDPAEAFLTKEDLAEIPEKKAEIKAAKAAKAAEKEKAEDASRKKQEAAKASEQKHKAESSKSAAEKSKPAEEKKEDSPFGKKPRKLASGDAITEGTPKKISAAADDSLAATARAFTKRKEAQEERREQKKRGQRTRYSGRSRNFGKSGSFRSGSRPNQRFRSGPGQMPADPGFRRSQDGKHKFGSGKEDGRTRYRDFGSSGRRKKQHDVRDELRDERIQRRRKKEAKRREERKARTPVTHVALPETLTVKEFAEAISRTSADVIMHLMKNGVMATMNQDLDYDTAAIIADEFGVTTEKLKEVKLSEMLFDESEDEEENLVPRPPVVVVMGHVDHGKTTLLDYIRKSDVAEDEAGGITQRIGAYMTELNGRKITFLDTPGHEAFTTMRARGAQATDIAILVVAADDGVMPQTIEAINHAKAAKTEIIVAINKMDLPAANPDRVKQELSQQGLIPEEWGGQTIMVPISAKTGEGVQELLEMVLLTADVMELKADPKKQAKGIIIEAQLDKARGAVATLLVQRGTLHQGDTIVANTVVGNVRAMKNAKGVMNEPAGPSVPVEVIGLPEVPEAGSLFYVVEDEKMARQFAEERREEEREHAISSGPAVTLDNLFSQIEEGKIIDFNIIIKADVVGSVEAMKHSLEELSNDEVRINIIHGAAGAINESDLRLAEASQAMVIGFNVRPSNAVSELAKELGVEIRLDSVIYHAIEDIEAAMKGMLAPEYEEVVIGHVEIRETYKVSSVGTIGGGYVTDGKIVRNGDVRLLRDNIVIYEGKLGSLRRFKDDVREVSQGYECGLTIENYNDIKVGDVVEVYKMEEVER